ncbi:hypothetical protein A0H81_05748 [Grifola frondosa]|uniref:Uncharacterized protein n=1 Tax=Grifola frondosa TaxID=5627 RepID=A0A1C7MCV5_GRIFR|nr:hypothetical protein A0H81_05748 [Grifola frondosa]
MQCCGRDAVLGGPPKAVQHLRQVDRVYYVREVHFPELILVCKALKTGNALQELLHSSAPSRRKPSFKDAGSTYTKMATNRTLRALVTVFLRFMHSSGALGVIEAPVDLVPSAKMTRDRRVSRTLNASPEGISTPHTCYGASHALWRSDGWTGHTASVVDLCSMNGPSTNSMISVSGSNQASLHVYPGLESCRMNMRIASSHVTQRPVALVQSNGDARQILFHQPLSQSSSSESPPPPPIISLYHGLNASHSDLLTFSPLFDHPVAMHISSSTHYQYDTDEGTQEFAKLLPSGGHVVYIDSNTPSSHPQVYTVTLFHQLKCLDTIRQQYATRSRNPSPLTRHCMNYLRQSILCHPNLRLEPAHNTMGSSIRNYDTVCRDWTKLYDEAERNQEAYSRRVI